MQAPGTFSPKGLCITRLQVEECLGKIAAEHGVHRALNRYRRLEDGSSGSLTFRLVDNYPWPEVDLGGFT